MAKEARRPVGALFGGDIGEAPSPPVKIEPAVEWAPLPAAPEGWGEYPFDGQPVLVKDGEARVAQAVWRGTRKWAGSGSRWRTTGFWAVRNAGGQKLPLEPVAYAKLVE
jgi:hypothetical protein